MRTMLSMPRRRPFATLLCGVGFLALVLPPITAAARGFGFGGGFHGGFGGGFHPGGFGGGRAFHGAPLNFGPHFNAPHGPGPGAPGFRPGPGAGPGPHAGPGPGPGPHPPGPGPGPHPPGPGPGPRPGPGPGPYNPGYWAAPFYPAYGPGVWAAGAAAGATLAIGTMAATLPEACETVVVSGVTYERCGATWYQPQYVGNRTVYAVVAPP